MCPGGHVKYRLQDTIGKPVHPAMQIGTVVLFPGSLYNGCFCKVQHLFLYIQLSEEVCSFFFICKGIGWALRERSYAAPDELVAFCREYATQLAPLTQREALRLIEKRRRQTRSTAHG